jgi:hypothetical protein
MRICAPAWRFLKGILETRGAYGGTAIRQILTLWPDCQYAYGIDEINPLPVSHLFYSSRLAD